METPGSPAPVATRAPPRAGSSTQRSEGTRARSAAPRTCAASTAAHPARSVASMIPSQSIPGGVGRPHPPDTVRPRRVFPSQRRQRELRRTLGVGAHQGLRAAPDLEPSQQRGVRQPHRVLRRVRASRGGRGVEAAAQPLHRALVRRGGAVHGIGRATQRQAQEAATPTPLRAIAAAAAGALSALGSQHRVMPASPGRTSSPPHPQCTNNPTASVIGLAQRRVINQPNPTS
jgi:hypothetical protein